MITVVGGIYHERCMRPTWNDVYGSAGRAAVAIARMGVSAELHGYADGDALYLMQSKAALEGFQLHATPVEHGVAFDYIHGLAVPRVHRPSQDHQPITLTKEKVLRFGMIEGTAVVDCDYAVYDPQNSGRPEAFSANGSKAKHLALVLNRYEATCMCQTAGLPPEEIVRQLAIENGAEVVVLKMGPLGALVFDKGTLTQVPAYKTDRVWKIGSGDTFAAHFALAWFEDGCSAGEAAAIASKATAFYCESQGHPSRKLLAQYQPSPIIASERFRAGYQPRVYLAGPFFSLAQLWMVNEARNDLFETGLDVFSPYHNVGQGSAQHVVEQDLQGIRDCDLLFAIGDGLDAGTIYEIGYARALNKPVVLYSENESEEDKKMMEGSDCKISDDYVSAIYKTVWAAVGL